MKNHQQLKWLDYRSRVPLKLNEAESLGSLVSSSSNSIQHLEFWQNAQLPDISNRLSFGKMHNCLISPIELWKGSQMP
jgi:hypothetical protein